MALGHRRRGDAVCFSVSAALLYLSRKQLLDMVEKYFARSLEQLVLLTLRVPDPRAPVATHLFEDHGLGGLAMGGRRGVLIAMSFANAITAVIGGLGAAFFLFRIDLPLTLVIIVLGPGCGDLPLSAHAAGGKKRQGPGEGSRSVQDRDAGALRQPQFRSHRQGSRIGR